MSKFYGNVGYVTVSESESPSVWAESEPAIRKYYGDVIKDTKRFDSGTSVNDDLTVNNSISILADAFAYEHFFAIAFVEWMGVRWKVTNVEVQRPRLILSLGGVYHGYEAGS